MQVDVNIAPSQMEDADDDPDSPNLVIDDPQAGDDEGIQGLGPDEPESQSSSHDDRSSSSMRQLVVPGTSTSSKCPQSTDPETSTSTKCPDEQALADLESKLKEFEKNQIEDNISHKNLTDRKKEMLGYVSDFFDSGKKEQLVKDTKQADIDLSKNPQSSFSQFVIPREQVIRAPLTKGKLLTPVDERRLAQEYKNLGVNRCPVCKFSTDDNELFKNHVTTCTPPKLPDKQGPVLLLYDGIYKCETCVISWKSRAEFEEHLVCHLIDDPYVCITCKKNFASRPLIETHARTDHPKGDSRCGLRGIKKGRKHVEVLEKMGQLTVTGKLNIPKTPRNQIKQSELTPCTAVSLTSAKTATASTATITTLSTTTTAGLGSAMTSSVQTMVGLASAMTTMPTAVGLGSAMTTSVSTVVGLASTMTTIASRADINTLSTTKAVCLASAMTTTASSAVDLASAMTTVSSAEDIASAMTTAVSSSVGLASAVTTTASSAVGLASAMTTVSSAVGLTSTMTTVSSAEGLASVMTTTVSSAVGLASAMTTVSAAIPAISTLSTTSSTTAILSTPSSISQTKPHGQQPNYHLQDKVDKLTEKKQQTFNTDATSGLPSSPLTMAEIPVSVQAISSKPKYESPPNISTTATSSTGSFDNFGSLFGMLDTETNTFLPANIPSKIQKIASMGPVPAKTALTENVNMGRNEQTGNISPKYHVKTFNEFTTAPTLTSPTVSTISSQPLILIPVGSVMLPSSTSAFTFQQNSNPIMGTSTFSGTRLQTSNSATLRYMNPVITPTQAAGRFILPTGLFQPNSNQVFIVNSNPTVATANNPSLPKTTFSQFRSPVVTKYAMEFPKARAAGENKSSILTTQLMATNHAIKAQLSDVSANQRQVPSLATKAPPSYLEAVSQLTSSAVPQQIGTVHNPQIVAVSDTKNMNAPQITTTTRDITISRLPKKFLFRIKPGQGFVCEACRKFTRDEYVYRRHIWDHFHSIPLACKTCDPESIARKEVLSCQLVNNIVCNLVKRSTEELLKAGMQTSVTAQAGQSEVIDISDDEDEVNNPEEKEKSHATEVFVVDDDDSDNEGHLQIKIMSSFSLSESGNHALEVMTKKEDEEDPKQNITSDMTPSVAADSKNNGQTNESKGNSVTGVENQLENMPMEVDKEVHTAMEVSQEVPVHKTIEGNQEVQIPMEVNESSDEETSVETDLINKSLSQPEKDSEQLVSQAVDLMLKDSDPRFSKQSKDLEEEMNKSESTCTRSLHDRTSSPVPSKTLFSKVQKSDPNSTLRQLFEMDTVTNHGHNAFYMCGYEHCSFSCLTSQKYREHLQEKHLNEYNYVCCHCGQKDYTEDSHVRHMYSHANAKVFLLFVCPVRLCKFRTNLLRMYGEHLKCHTSEELNIKCVNCNKIFPTIESLTTHLNQNLLKFVNCPNCSFRFVHKDIVCKHIKISHPDKPRMVLVTSQIVCQEREINFYVTPLVKKNALSKVMEKDILDSQNIDIDAMLDEVEKGKEKAPLEEAPTEVVESSPNKEEGNGAKNVTQEDKLSLIDTQKLSNISGTKLKINLSAGPKSLRCPRPNCNYLSYNKSFHVQHIALHKKQPERERRFVCNLCPKGADNLVQFKKHLTNHVGRNEIKVFCCTTCTFNSNQKSHIMDHCSDNHSGKGKYIQKIEEVESIEITCKFCDFKARQAEPVIQHEQLVHRINDATTTENTEVLQDADKPQQSTSKEEEGIIKKRKYHCEYCKNYFKHKVNLKEHMVIEHTDIENKQFVFYKCKYCSYTSTMKDMIVNHMGKDHKDKEIRILRKIENVESKSVEEKGQTETSTGTTTEERVDESSKEEVLIPDGNTFKQPFICPKCPFSNTLRLNVMRHIKNHPELKPVREFSVTKSPSKKTARKSTGINKSDGPQKYAAKKQNSLIQCISESQPLQNPFTSVKEAVVAQQEASVSPTDNPYILGEDKLHAKLSACFIPLENDMKFKCRICKQKIAKKFVLHRHILDHLDIVFFKCKYCKEGSIEKTLLYGHIQKEHTLQPLQFHEVSCSELDNQFKEKIFSQNFNNTVDLYESSDKSNNPLSAEKSGLVLTAVHETTAKPIETDTRKESVVDVRECPHCPYIAVRQNILKAHIAYHNDPTKIHTCSACHYLGDKINVIRHVYRQHGKQCAKILVHGKPLSRGENKTSVTETAKRETIGTGTAKDEATRQDREDSIESLCSVSSDEKFITNSQGKKIKTDTLTVSKSGVFEMKSVFKCKDCGLKRDSRGALYSHFKNTKCKRPFYQCSICSFQSAFKSDIWKHAKIRHSGTKVTILDLPMKDKMKLIKFPIKQDNNLLKELEKYSQAKSEKRSPAPAQNTSTTTSASSATNNSVTCQLCTSYRCESIMKLQFHINTAHGGRMLFCQECIYKTPLVKHMINHCTNVHVQKVVKYKLEPKGSPENKVKAEAKESSEPLEESDNEFKYKCSKCDYQAEDYGRIKRHLNSDVHFNYKPFVCKYCEKDFQSLGNVKRHIDTVHEGDSSKYREVRNETIDAKIEKILDQLKREKKRHDQVSGKTRPSSLNKLPLIEEGVRKDGSKYFCDFCGYSSSKRSQVRKHYSIIHPKVNKKRSLDYDSDTELRQKKIAKLSVVESSDTDEDNNDDEDNDEKFAPVKYQVALNADGTRQYKCVQCEYKTSKKKLLRQHMTRHGARFFKCMYCDYSSKMITNAYRHIESIHKDKKVQVINKSTNQVVQKKKTSEMFSPRKETHSSSPASPSMASISDRSGTGSSTDFYSPFKPKKRTPSILKYCCNICPLVIEGMYHFRQHLAIHADFKYLTKGTEIESKLSCGYCSYMALDQFDFSNHISSHLGDRPYKCAYCDYSSHQKNKVLSHTRNIHPAKEEKCIDGENRIGKNSQILLVNFDPQVSVERIQIEKRKSKKSNIIIETDDESSPNTSFGENADMEVHNTSKVGKSLNEDELKKLTLVLKKKIPESLNSSYEVVSADSNVNSIPKEVRNNTSDREIRVNKAEVGCIADTKNAKQDSALPSEVAKFKDDNMGSILPELTASKIETVTEIMETQDKNEQPSKTHNTNEETVNVNSENSMHIDNQRGTPNQTLIENESMETDDTYNEEGETDSVDMVTNKETLTEVMKSQDKNEQSSTTHNNDEEMVNVNNEKSMYIENKREKPKQTEIENKPMETDETNKEEDKTDMVSMYIENKREKPKQTEIENKPMETDETNKEEVKTDMVNNKEKLTVRIETKDKKEQQNKTHYTNEQKVNENKEKSMYIENQRKKPKQTQTANEPESGKTGSSVDMITKTDDDANVDISTNKTQTNIQDLLIEVNDGANGNKGLYNSLDVPIIVDRKSEEQNLSDENTEPILKVPNIDGKQSVGNQNSQNDSVDETMVSEQSTSINMDDVDKCDSVVEEQTSELPKREHVPTEDKNLFTGSAYLSEDREMPNTEIKESNITNSSESEKVISENTDTQPFTVTEIDDSENKNSYTDSVEKEQQPEIAASDTIKIPAEEVSSNMAGSDSIELKKDSKNIVDTNPNVVENIFERFKYDEQMGKENKCSESITETSKTGNITKNVFEKFDPSVERGNATTSNEDVTEKDERGLFEKFGNECDVEIELESLDKFDNPEQDSEDKASSPDHENIFEKFAREHSLEKDSEPGNCDNLQQKSEEAISKQNDRSIFEKMTSEHSILMEQSTSETDENVGTENEAIVEANDFISNKANENIFDKFASVAESTSSKIKELHEKNECDKKENEDMEIDELIETLENTVQENKAEISKRGGKVDEESMDIDND